MDGIDESGEVAGAPKYLEAGNFSDGYAPVKSYDGSWGYIDKEGNLVISFGLHEADTFKEGIARVKFAEKYGFIKITTEG